MLEMDSAILYVLALLSNIYYQNIEVFFAVIYIVMIIFTLFEQGTQLVSDQLFVYNLAICFRYSEKAIKINSSIVAHNPDYS